MRTGFTPEQLHDPDIRESERILRKCVHCGFCTATCPTYVLLGDERDSPRGRISLIQDMLQQGTIPAAGVVTHIDRCLSCLSCMTTCPSGVDYRHLIGHARQYVEKTGSRSFWERTKRWLLALFLPYPRRLRMALRARHLARFIRPLLPGRYRGVLNLGAAPQLKLKRNPLRDVYRAEHKVRGNVALLAGCVQQVSDNEINEASIRVLNRLGYNVYLLRKTDCCGAIEHQLGKTRLLHRRLGRNGASWDRLIRDNNLRAIITNASGCGTMLKDYGFLFRNKKTRQAETATRISALTCDITEFLQQEELDSILPDNPLDLKVAYQSPCSMQHGQKINAQPQALLTRFGFKVSPVAEAHLCCGSAGTYNILQPALARQLGQRKADAIHQARADFVASGNLGCMIQLSPYLDIPIAHTIQLIDWACGGPRPL